MTKKIQISLTLTALITFCHWGMNDDNNSIDGSGKRPSVNFIGKIADNSASNRKFFDAEYITISGLYKQIPVYAKPQDLQNQKYDPSTNVIFVDLSEIAKITLPELSEPYVFNNKQYIDIIVTSNGAESVQRPYIIEANKKVICAEINPAGPIERELAFSVVREIRIDRYEQPAPKEEAKPAIKHEVKKSTPSAQEMAQAEKD